MPGGADAQIAEDRRGRLGRAVAGSFSAAPCTWPQPAKAVTRAAADRAAGRSFIRSGDQVQASCIAGRR